MLRKRQTPTFPSQAKKRRKTAYAIEEIKFDPSAREDYLTGFHKRKLQRIKLAKKEAAKKEREAKIEARRILRDGRKADLEKHVQEVDSMVAQALGFDSEEETKADVEPWSGIGDVEEVDHEEEYVDEDRFTTVTVEAVDVSRDGLRKVVQEDESENPDDLEHGNTPSTNGVEEAQKGRLRRVKEQPGGVKKKKKKKFRYETKAERQVTRHKERLGNKKQAIARKM